MRTSVLKLLVCLFVVTIAACSDVGNPEDVTVGNHAPTFSLKALDGSTVTSDSLKGNPVVLNFWATWCQPCLSEIPELKELASTSKVKIVGIALDEDGVKTIKPFVEKNGINYPVLVGDQEVFQRFNGVGIPYTLVLDSSQRIIKIYRGPTTKAALEQDLKNPS